MKQCYRTILRMKKLKVRSTWIVFQFPELLYHITLIDLMSRCCAGFNHLPEVMCQSLVPVSVCLDVIKDPQAGLMLKGAYLRFVSEVSHSKTLLILPGLVLHCEAFEPSW